MCLYSAFRQRIRASFPALACSLMMYEKGSGVGGELTMYRVQVPGGAVETVGVTAGEVVSRLVTLVGAAQPAQPVSVSEAGQCLYTNFRQQVRKAFDTLICSVMMYEKQAADGTWCTMYRAKVQGQPIGAAQCVAEAPTAEEVIQKLIAQVAPARRAVKTAREHRLVSRFAELVPLSGGVSRQLVASRGGLNLALAA